MTAHDHGNGDEGDRADHERDGDRPGHDHSETDHEEHHGEHHDHDETDHEEHHGEHHDHDHGEHHDHGHHGHDVTELGVAVLTVSSSRDIEDDPAGDAIAEILEGAGHEVVIRELVTDSYDAVQDAVDRLAGRDDSDCVVTTGGTGVTPDDVTVEALEPLFGKRLPGFGELFRRLSYEEIGTKVVGTRAVAGIVGAVPVFCLPGSENAARLGTDEIILEEAPHLAGLAGRDEASGG